MEIISSLQNARIKNLIKLQTKMKERKDQQLVLVEGAREINIALQNGYRPETVFVCPSRYAKSDYKELLRSVPESAQIELTLPVFEKVAYREGSDGVIALLRPKSHQLSDLTLSEHPFLIVLEAVEKPGNLGAILRTADAAKVDAVLVCDPLTDIYNPNVVRSSIGCLFSVPLAVCSSQEACAWMKSKQIKMYAAELLASEWYYQKDFRASSAVIMGTEADGLSPFWLKNADERIKIPMRGLIDSLNVSVSTAVLTFEAMRQRDFR